MAVLGITAVLALIVLFAVFTVSLDTLASANARDATLAESQAEAALALGVASASEAAATGGSVVDRTFGPWPAYGVDAGADVTQVDADALRVLVTARVGRALARRSAILRSGDLASPSVLARP